MLNRTGEPNTHSQPAGWRAALVVDRGNRPSPPVTLPALNLPPLDDAAEQAEAAHRFAEYRILAAARRAWGINSPGRNGKLSKAGKL